MSTNDWVREGKSRVTKRPKIQNTLLKQPLPDNPELDKIIDRTCREIAELFKAPDRPART